MRRHHRRAGFTLLELAIFIAALLVLITIAAPRLVRVLERERSPASVTVIDSASATVAPGAIEEIAVRVLDSRGEPVKGHRIEIVASDTTDRIEPARPATDTMGVARMAWHIGSTPGSRSLRTVVQGSELQAQFSTILDESVGAPAVDTVAAMPEPATTP